MFRLRFLVLLGLLLLADRVALGSLVVSANVTPLSGSYRYEFTITNTLLTSPDDDVVVISIVDAPMGDPLIGPSLETPPGFLALYDSGLGIVDFLEDTSNFAAGTTTSGFRFESLAAPGSGFFSTFEAFTVGGDFLTGNVQTQVVPEPGSCLVFGLVLGIGVLGQRMRRARRVAR